ncbi:hypothetical protein MASR2M69_19470 [Bacteroidota bacterium]
MKRILDITISILGLVLLLPLLIVISLLIIATMPELFFLDKQGLEKTETYSC